MPQEKLLQMAKGNEFATLFMKLMVLLDNLADMGLENVRGKKNDIMSMISGKVKGKVMENLKKSLEMKLHATVECRDQISNYEKQ